MKLSSVSALQLFNIIRFGTTVLISILLAKSDLSTTEISIYEAFLFFANMASFFWISGGQSALLQYFPNLDSDSKKKTLFNVWLFFLFASIIAGVCLFLFQNTLLGLAKFETPPPFDLLCLFLIFNTPAWLTPIFYLLSGKNKQILTYGIISFSLQIIVVMLPLWFGFTLRETFLGLVILGVGKFIWSLFLVAKFGDLKTDFTLLKTYLILAFPLILHVLIGSSVEYVDGLIVTSHFEDGTFAIFRYGAKELPLTLLLIGAIVMALIPQVSEDLKSGLQQIKIETQKLSKWLFPLSAFLILVSPYLFPLVFNPEFAESAEVFNVYLLIISSRILLPQVVLIAHKKNYFLVLSAIIETVLNISLSLILVKNYGLVGIAFATVIAYLINKLILIYFNWKILKIAPNRYIDFGSWLIYNSLLFGTFLIF